MAGTVVDTVTAMVSPILADLGLELYDLEFSGGVLRVTIDTPAGSPAGVDIDAISLVSRLLGRELDHEESAVPGRFTLEVTSPGLERTLRTPEHYRRETGKTVSVRLVAPLDGRRRLTGLLADSDESSATVVLDENGEKVVFPLSQVERTRTVFVWESQPKPNSPEARRARRAAAETSTSDEEVGAR